MTSLRYYVIVIGLCLCTVGSFAQTSEMEQRYNALAERFEVRDKALMRDLKTYLQAYPYTTFVDEVNFMQAVLYAEKSVYKQSLKMFETVDRKALTRPHQLDYSFYRGYSFMMLEDYRSAHVYFHVLSKTENRYTVRSKYYYAYCMYKQGEYDKALPYFNQLENDPTYAKTVPYFLTQIYYAKGEYDEAENRLHAQKALLSLVMEEDIS